MLDSTSQPGPMDIPGVAQTIMAYATCTCRSQNLQNSAHKAPFWEAADSFRIDANAAETWTAENTPQMEQGKLYSSPADKWIYDYAVIVPSNKDWLYKSKCFLHKGLVVQS